MALTKNNERGECPFSLFELCNPKCVLYRKGIRYSESPGKEPIPFEDCAVNIIADNLEAMHNRTYMMQKEVGDTKNMIAIKTMIDLFTGDKSKESHVEYLKDQIIKLSEDNTKLISDK